MNLDQSFAVVIPAAGTGSRFGGGDKLLCNLCGQSVLQRAVALFANRPDVAEILIVTAPDRFDTYRTHLNSLPNLNLQSNPSSPSSASSSSSDRLRFVPGGRERWESVLFGLRAVPPEIGFVAIHDAARPLAPVSVIQAAFYAARQHGGALPLLAEPATLKRAGADGVVTGTVERAGLFQAQTPQCFARDKLLAAYEKLLAEGALAGVTDDAQVFERVGLTVVGTPGSPLNLKITTADDIALACALLAAAEVRE